MSKMGMRMIDTSSPHVRQDRVLRWADERVHDRDDLVAVEEPLEIRVSGQRFATTMRTPGHDEALALGLLCSEGIIATGADVLRVARLPALLDERPPTIDVHVQASADAVSLVRRGTLTTSACGVCARGGVADLLAQARPVRGEQGWLPSSVSALPYLASAAPSHGTSAKQ